MIAFTPEARQQAGAHRDHYRQLERMETVRGLRQALPAAWDKITADPAVGFTAPRPYPDLAREGRPISPCRACYRKS